MTSGWPRTTRTRSSTGGFTLIEIMIVFAIVALLAGASVQGFRSLRKADLREATTGKMHRLVIDMETGTYWAEVSDDKFFIPREETEREMRRREEKEADEDDEDAKKRDRAAKEAESG